jgi:hypothetical protein
MSRALAIVKTNESSGINREMRLTISCPDANREGLHNLRGCSAPLRLCGEPHFAPLEINHDFIYPR